MASHTERQENLLAKCVDSFKCWKELIDTHLEGDEKIDETRELEEIVKEFCCIDYTASKASETCREIVDHFNDDSTNHEVDIEELYKTKLENKRPNFDGKFQNQKIWKQVFSGFKDLDVEEIEQETENTANTQYEEMEESILCSNVFTPPVDPISKMVIKEPYKNKTCGHIYEYKFIVQYIKAMKKKAKCPYMGCGNRNLKMAELSEDKETKKKITQYLNSQSQAHNDNESSD